MSGSFRRIWYEGMDQGKAARAERWPADVLIARDTVKYVEDLLPRN